MPEVSARRPGTPADAVDGVVPACVAEPDTPEAFAETLASASAERLQTVIRGGGTKLGWGRPPASVDLLVSTARLNRLIAHRYGDLTATVQAGMPLADLERELRRHGQWLPVDFPFPGATVGGLVATNDAGPWRHRAGTPRDLVIGVTLALTDGRLVKAGGTVVKNVAGYDLGRLMSGSHGSLAGLVDVTFKLMPAPLASVTLVGSYSDPEALSRDVAAIAQSQLEPAAFDVRAEIDGTRTALSLLVRFATSPAAAEAQAAAAAAMMGGRATALAQQEETDLWAGQVRLPWQGDGLVARMSWLPARLPAVLALVASAAASAGGSAVFTGRALGAGLFRLDADAAAQRSALARLRGSTDVGHVVVLRASPDVKSAVDVWGAPRDADAVARALKQMFDPAGILNAGRGPV